MFAFILSLIWRFDAGDASFIGWAVTAAYLVGAVLCARTSIVARQARSQSSGTREPWGIIATVLLLLGINKQLDLQTLLIEIGRKAAWAEGWYDYRRTTQAVFVVLFTLALVAVLVVFITKWRLFFKENPTALIGMVLLLVFVLIRAAGFNHVEELLHVNLRDDVWGWVLELGGSACLARSAAKVKSN